MGLVPGGFELASTAAASACGLVIIVLEAMFSIDCRTMKPIGSNFVWGLVVAGLRRQNLDGGFLSANDAKRDWGSFLTTAALHAAETTGSCGTEYFTSVCCLLMVKQLKEWATLSQM